ncbi:MAG: DUF2304 domain-containing protein [Zavarzinella sp.]
MNLFQWIALPTLSLLFIWDCVALIRSAPRLRLDRVIRCLIWFLAAVAVRSPDITVRLANSVGISRGTDLVLYLFVFASIGTAFHFYGRIVKLERQITDLIRHIAINNAENQPTDHLPIPTSQNPEHT